MRVLVTGAAGFVGTHLIRELQCARHSVVAVDAVAPGDRCDDDPEAIVWRSVDILEADSLSRVLSETRPEAVVHLAAIASVPQSRADPDLTYRVNVQGTLNLLRAVRRYDSALRVLVVSTAQVYGNRRRTTPIPEDATLEPDNAYAESKAWADFLALRYADRLGMAVMTVRPHNHTGPGQSPTYAVPAFAAQVAAVAHGRAGLPLRVGNLDSRRDMSDVRDVVAAYRLLLENGRPGRAYNLASGTPVAMREVLEHFCRLAKVPAETKVDPARWRATDESPVLDTSAIRAHTGWWPRIALPETLQAVWSTMETPSHAAQ